MKCKARQANGSEPDLRLGPPDVKGTSHKQLGASPLPTVAGETCLRVQDFRLVITLD